MESIVFTAAWDILQIRRFRRKAPGFSSPTVELAEEARYTAFCDAAKVLSI